MPAVETVTVINKSGKIVSTGKHLVSIFRDARAAYNDKKNELKSELLYRAGGHNNLARQGHHCDTSRRSHRSHRSNRSNRSHRSHRSNRSDHSLQTHRKGEDLEPFVLPLTAQNLSSVTESSKISSSSHSPSSYQESYCPPPYAQDDDAQPTLMRRHTAGPASTQLTSTISTLPPTYVSRVTRTRSHPDLSSDSTIDMNLAYGELPYDLVNDKINELSQEEELFEKMDRIDQLLLESQCLQSSATAIIHHLQSNPDAMAAVALTLAELSTLVSKTGPTFIGILKLASPAIFALLVSPQFMIATGLAMGATAVMLGGFQIIKRIQSNNEEKNGAHKTQSPMLVDGVEIESIKSWQRGVANAENLSLSSADSEYITPEAAKKWKERMLSRKSGSYLAGPESVTSDQTNKITNLTESSSHTAHTESSRNSSRVVPLYSSSRISTIAPSDSASNIGGPKPSRVGSRKSRAMSSEVSRKSGRAAPSEASRKSGRAAPSEASRKSGRAAPSEASRKSGRAAPSEASRKSGRVAPSETSRKSSRATPSEVRNKGSQAAPSKAKSKNSQTAPSEVSTRNSRDAPSNVRSKSSQVASSKVEGKSSQIGPSEFGIKISRKGVKSTSSLLEYIVARRVA